MKKEIEVEKQEEAYNMEKLPVSVLETVLGVDNDKAATLLKAALTQLGRKIVVLDDDPTGVQTVHGVSVYTSWDEEALRAGFAEDNSIFFILTNSRGLSTMETAVVHADIAKTLCKVAADTGKDYILISRSDSTMRGHFPLETATLRETVEQNSAKRFDGEIIFPFFKEGGRYTMENIHYVREGDVLVPAGETEFAKDKSFGYTNSHIGAYVEEKTKGAFTQEGCTYISLADLRAFDVKKITEQLMAVTDFGKVIVNAVDYVDVQIFAIAFVRAVLAGKEFMFRSAAAVTKVLGGVADKPLLNRGDLIEADNKNGGIVLVGSHVNKTTRQLELLKDCAQEVLFLEFNQHLVVTEAGLAPEVERVVALAEENIRAGKSVAAFTRRDRFDLDTEDKDKQLAISVEISDAVTSIISKLQVRPSFIIAKGGITSSDVGTKALQVQKAQVMGQIKPGIPVWMTGSESKFPHMPYVIFPGNVGEEYTLRDIVDELS